MERRDDKRRARRVPIRFWQRGEEKARAGFTTNISDSGMFIGSNLVHGRGTRLRVEVLDPLHGFVVEGVVARAIRSQPAVQSVRPSGMGIRFLQVTELVEELFPPRHIEREPVSVSSSPEPPGPPPQGSIGVTQLPSYSVQYRNCDELRVSFERDISKGGLFINTPQPAPLQQVVVIEIRLLEGSHEPVRLQAKVVHCLRPESGGETNLLAGMGLELLDPVRAREALRPMLEGSSSPGPTLPDFS